MGFMSLWMLIGLLVLLALVGGVASLAMRSGHRHLPPGDDARTLLNRRLAAGEITAEEYFERESALRSGEPRPSRRRR
ncbi:hypothetical protein [Conexibacter sp. DBS9H8]|uniref:hypothetical protein n=1 Tax=Conexibacter sp. DBS9H8 TaxID=2937801 RepID=UPI00200FE2FA|nr:hypothetical protein [Conexibacter sp. DBS9H8]